MNSCLYEGLVRHRRFAPVSNSFSYRLFQVYLDLAELDIVFSRRWLWSTDRWNVASFFQSDHLDGTRTPLDQQVRTMVEERFGFRPDGPIRLLTHLRYFGYVMNPVSFFYCFDRLGTRVQAIVAEVNNTPWGERHCYALDSRSNKPAVCRSRFAKQFHVSPFMSLDDIEYDWSFTVPGSSLFVHMINRRGGEKLFDASLRLQRRPIDGVGLAKALCRRPAMTAKVTAAIYWQALKLYMKSAPCFEHPKFHKDEVTSK